MKELLIFFALNAESTRFKSYKNMSHFFKGPILINYCSTHIASIYSRLLNTYKAHSNG